MANQMLPEVDEYIEAQKRVEAFRAEHYNIFSQYLELTEMRDRALENADKAVKASGTPCGPWKVHSRTTKYDPEKLLEEIGREDFLKVGGIIETQTVYKIDEARIEQAIAKGDLPKEVIDAFRTLKVSFSGPKKSIVP